MATCYPYNYIKITMIRYQGEDIQFNLELQTLVQYSAESWDEFSSVVVYLYTNSNYIAKFNITNQTGYAKLEKSEDGKFLSGVLSREETKKMNGALYMDILAKYPSDIVNIKSIATGVTIAASTIKQEG